MAGRYFRISGCFAHAYGSYQYLNPRTGVVEVFGDQTGVGEGDTFGVPYLNDKGVIKAFVYIPEGLMYMFLPIENNRVTTFNDLDAAYEDAREKHFSFADLVWGIAGTDHGERKFIQNWFSRRNGIQKDIIRRYEEGKIAWYARKKAEFLRKQERQGPDAWKIQPGRQGC